MAILDLEALERVDNCEVTVGSFRSHSINGSSTLIKNALDLLHSQADSIIQSRTIALSLIHVLETRAYNQS